ncbi:smn family protein smn1 [Teratosphaeria destructans]|uniref:Smn family protein smn1 n=1 Tax=Teratosphaeria destructans TaxID=418781 RepID=A0A9W7W506_9PEZI|nr:smn family protein smn1 [Teratosphaeria destructans]
MAEEENPHLSHAEVWDDSVLVESWNEALAEYKKYHSLAAEGEKIDIVLDEAEDGEVEDAAAQDETAHDHDVTVEQPPQVNGAEAEPATALPANGTAAPPVAPALPGGTAVPQVLMSTGTTSTHLAIEILLMRCCSARRRSQEHHDELVLCWLLHWSLRGAAEGLRRHAATGLTCDQPQACLEALVSPALYVVSWDDRGSEIKPVLSHGSELRQSSGLCWTHLSMFPDANRHHLKELNWRFKRSRPGHCCLHDPPLGWTRC